MDIDELNFKLQTYFKKFKEKVKTTVNPLQKANNIFEINLSELKAKGITAIILDLDDTLLAKTSTDITPKLYDFVEALKSMGFKTCISSNNRFPSRVAFVARELELPYISLAFKPLPAPFIKALELLGSKKEETVIIGDQLFTDILGGNLFGIHTILVKPLSKETSSIRKFMRKAEDFFLKM